MSDDESESDIETLFQDAHKDVSRKQQQQSKRMNHDDDDEDEEDDDMIKGINRSSFGRRKSKNELDQKLQQFSYRQEMNARKLRKLSDTTKNDSDDDSDIEVIVNDPANTSTSEITATTAAKRTSPRRSARIAKEAIVATPGTTTTTTKPSLVSAPVILLDDDSDDDYINNNATTGTTNRRQGGPHLYQNNHPGSSVVPSVLGKERNQFQAAMSALPISNFGAPSSTAITGATYQNQALSQRQQRKLLSSMIFQQQTEQQLKIKVNNIMNAIDVDAIVAGTATTTLPTLGAIDQHQPYQPYQPSQTQLQHHAILLRLKVIATIIPSSSTANNQSSRNQSSVLTASSVNNTSLASDVVDLTEAITSKRLSKNGIGDGVDMIRGSTVVSCTVDIIETSTVQVLMDRILQHYLHKSPKHNVIGLQYNNEPLYCKHTLDMYRIPPTGATVVAIVHSSDPITAHAANANGTASKRAVNASSSAVPSSAPVHKPKGNIITVVLRRSIATNNNKTSTEETPIKIGNLDPLQVVVDQYRALLVQKQQSSSSSSSSDVDSASRCTITLQFDGDVMNLQRTATQYEIDNDDLIDVIIK